jgi:hypothetical protein
VLAGQHREEGRKEIGGDGGDDAQSQSPRQGRVPGRRDAFQFAHFGEDGSHPGTDGEALSRHGQAAGRALEQRRAEEFLHLRDLRGERRLADVEAPSGTAEMQRLAECLEIAKLAKGDHRHRIN